MIIQPLFWIYINNWAWSMFKAGSRQSKHSSYAWISPTLKIQACLLWVTTCDHIIRFFTWWTLKAMCAIHWCLSSPPRSSLPHLQFFNALLFASPWILVPSWSLMMFGHSKIVLLNHLKPKPYWWIAKFREMDLLKNIFKILPLFTDFSFETPFQCGWASKSKAGPNRSNSISSDATAVKLSDLVGLKLWQQTFAETSQRGKLSPGFFLQNLHLRPFGSPGLKWICSNEFHGKQFQKTI